MTKLFKNLLALPKERIVDFINSFNVILYDCDGVLWLEENALPGSVAAFKKLRSMGKQAFFLTNNSTVTIDHLVKKANHLGYDIGKEGIISAPYMAANYLKGKKEVKKCYMIGSPGLAKELENAGIEVEGLGPDPFQGPLKTYVSNLKLNPDIQAVVVGFDPHISLCKMIKAISYICKGCIFLGNNPDLIHPWGGEIRIPASGSLVKTIEVCSGRKPIIMGKPHTAMFDYIKKKYRINPEKTIMIGDTLHTDILFGFNCKIKTLLVLSGSTKLDDCKYYLENKQIDYLPNYYIDTLGYLLPYL